MLRSFIQAATALLLFAGVAGCDWAADSAANSESLTSTAAINEAFGSPESNRIELGIDSCNADPEARVAETSSDVQVEIRLRSPVPEGEGGDCQDSLFVELESPLADRTLTDVTTGDPVVVQPAE